MAAIVPMPLRTADSMQDVRISTASVWSDRTWQLDVTLPGTVRSDVALDWGFALADGSCFTDPQWTPWRETAKRFLWTLRVDPPAGHRRARDSSLVRAFQHLRVLIRWMAGEGYRLSQKCRKKVEECFGWLKSVAGMGRSRVVGRWKLRQLLEVSAAAFNLVRMRRLAPMAG